MTVQRVLDGKGIGEDFAIPQACSDCAKECDVDKYDLPRPTCAADKHRVPGCLGRTSRIFSKPVRGVECGSNRFELAYDAYAAIPYWTGTGTMLRALDGIKAHWKAPLRWRPALAAFTWCPAAAFIAECYT